MKQEYSDTGFAKPANADPISVKYHVGIEKDESGAIVGVTARIVEPTAAMQTYAGATITLVLSGGQEIDGFYNLGGRIAPSNFGSAVRGFD